MMGAEFVAACGSAKENMWVKQLLSNLGGFYNYIILYVASQSRIKLVNIPGNNKRAKHIDVK